MPSNKYNSINNYLQSNFLGELKQALLDNIKHKSCNPCWSDESISAWSNRLNTKINKDFNIIITAY